MSIALVYVVKDVQIYCMRTDYKNMTRRVLSFLARIKKSLGNLELAMYFLGSEEEKKCKEINPNRPQT